MTILPLDAANEKDRAIWRENFERLPPVCRDIHFDPEYMQVYADAEGSRAQCLINEWGEPFPFIRRGNELGNAYGYGFAVPVKSIVLAKWLEQEGIEKIRYRPHPFLPRWGPHEKQEKLIVYMDLSLDPRAELRKGHASSIVLANKSGVTVDESHDIELFYAMYCAMLERNEADPKWKFSINLLIKLREAYPDGFRIFIASVDGQPEAGCVLLNGYGTMYYHYAGSFGRWRSIGVNNLLVIKAAEYAKAIGCKRLHLGGGLTADSSDTLLRFKTGFSKHRCWVYKYQWQAKAEAA